MKKRKATLAARWEVAISVRMDELARKGKGAWEYCFIVLSTVCFPRTSRAPTFLWGLYREKQRCPSPQHFFRSDGCRYVVADTSERAQPAPPALTDSDHEVFESTRAPPAPLRPPPLHPRATLAGYAGAMSSFAESNGNGAIAVTVVMAQVRS